MQIQIGIYVFEIPERYAEGEPIGSAEAVLLNNAHGAGVMRSVEGRIRAAAAAAAAEGRDLLSEAELEELDEAMALKNISTMPARVKCAVLSWHTLQTALEKKDK